MYIDKRVKALSSVFLKVKKIPLNRILSKSIVEYWKRKTALKKPGNLIEKKVKDTLGGN